MKVIECSAYRDSEGKVGVVNGLRAALDFGFGWFGMIPRKTLIAERLAKSLGDEHVLIRNPTLPGVRTPEPLLVMIGPQGVRVLYVNPIRGVYRAKGEEWLSFDSARRKFKRSRPNLQSSVLTMAKVVRLLLSEQGYDLQDIEAVLVLTNPRTLVDTARPRARVVTYDAVDYFAANLLQHPSLLSASDIKALTAAIVSPKLGEPEPAPEPEPYLEPSVEPFTEPFAEPEPLYEAPAFLEPQESYAAEPYYPESQEQELDFLQDLGEPAEDQYGKSPRARTFLGLQRRQWIVIAALFGLEVIIIAAFAVLVLTGVLAR